MDHRNFKAADKANIELWVIARRKLIALNDKNIQYSPRTKRKLTWSNRVRIRRDYLGIFQFWTIYLCSVKLNEVFQSLFVVLHFSIYSYFYL